LASWLLRLLACPACHGTIEERHDRLFCVLCGRAYEVHDGIPVMKVREESEAVADQHRFQERFYDKEFSGFTRYRLDNWRLSYVQRIFAALDIGRGTPSNPPRHEGLYLDVGVGGSGYTVIEAAKQGIFSVGTDSSLVGMLRARAFAGKERCEGRAGFVVCRAEALPFRTGIFSRVSSVAVLEHVLRDVQAMKEMRRVAGSRCRLFIMVPNRHEDIPWIIRPFYSYNDRKVGHLRHYGVDVLTEKLCVDGFQKVSVAYTGHLVKLLHLLFPAWTRPGSLLDRLWWWIEERDLQKEKNSSAVHLSMVVARGLEGRA